MTDAPAPARTASSAPAPKVTVAALCYNHERFVESCLESVRAQTLQDFELLVFDDASTDGSRAVIERWLARHYPDARLVAHPVNRGVCATLNEVLAAARGRYLALASTDDLWEPDKLARHVAVLDAEGDDVAMVYSDAWRIDVDGRPIPGDFIGTHRPDLAPPSGHPPSGDLREALARGNFIPAMSVTLRVDALRAVGGWDPTLAFEDYDMWLRLASDYRIRFLPGRLSRYRVVPNSLNHELTVGRRQALAATYCRMALKQARNPRLTPAIRAVWTERLVDYARELYDANSPDAPRFLRAVARLAPTRRRVVGAAAATLGLTRPRLDRLRLALGRLRRGHVPAAGRPG